MTTTAIVLVSLVGSFFGTIIGYVGMTLVLAVMTQRRAAKLNRELDAFKAEMQAKVYAALAAESIQESNGRSSTRAEA
jgi:hypothetical protein